MTEEYHFVFEHMPPEDLQFCRKTGEWIPSIGSFRVLADSRAEALSWGNELARWGYGAYYDTTELSWDCGAFHSWIEDRPTEMIFVDTPVIEFGHYPEKEDIDEYF